MDGRGWVRFGIASRPARVALALVSLLCAACGAASSGQPAKPLQHASMLWVGATASQSIAWLAEDGGYFRKNGVDVDLSFQSGSPTASASLAGGHVDFVQMAGPAVISSDAKGADEVMVMGLVPVPTFVLMVSADVRTPDQLKGKSVGVVQVGSSDDFMLRAALQHWGLRPDTDVKIVPLNSIQGQIAAFQQHLVQGLVVDPPNDLLAEQVGGHRLVRIADLGIPYQAAGLVTTRTFLRQHRAIVVDVVQAMIQAIHRFKTDRAFAERTMAHYLKTDDKKVLDASYQAFAGIFPREPLPNLAGLREIADLDQQAGLIKGPVDVSAMADSSIVTQLQKNGFIDRVYR
jgi:NitT/TauT family transport system substrate-binding protein